MRKPGQNETTGRHAMPRELRALRENLDLGDWSPRGRVLAYCFRLCDPSERRSKAAIQRELGIPHATAYRWEADYRFRDLMVQVHVAFNGLSYYEVFRKTLQQALDGNVQAQRLFFTLTGHLNRRGEAVQPPIRGEDEPSTAIDPVTGEPRAKIEAQILESLRLIRQRRLASEGQPEEQS